MRAYRYAAVPAAACLVLLFTGCERSAPTTAPAAPAQITVKGSPKPPPTSPSDAPNAKAPGTPAPQTTAATPEAPPPPRPPKPATQIAELMILEGELRLKLTAAADPGEREALARRIEETERKRIALYNSLTETRP